MRFFRTKRVLEDPANNPYGLDPEAEPGPKLDKRWGYHANIMLYYTADINWAKKERTPLRNKPSFGLVMNFESGKFYRLKIDLNDPVYDLMLQRKIDFFTEDWTLDESDAINHHKDSWTNTLHVKFTFVDRFATVEDILENMEGKREHL